MRAFHWWRSGNKKRTQNVSEYMLVLAVCLVGICAVQVYDFLLVVHCNYVSILYRFKDITINYFSKFKEVT